MINSEKDNAMEINLEGSLTIMNAGEIKEKLWAALNGSSEISLNVENAIDCDFSFYQLLYSFLKTSEKLGKKITLINIQPELKNSMKISGFININYPEFQQ